MIFFIDFHLLSLLPSKKGVGILDVWSSSRKSGDGDGLGAGFILTTFTYAAAVSAKYIRLWALCDPPVADILLSRVCHAFVLGGHILVVFALFSLKILPP